MTNAGLSLFALYMLIPSEFGIFSWVLSLLFVVSGVVQGGLLTPVTIVFGRLRNSGAAYEFILQAALRYFIVVTTIGMIWLIWGEGEFFTAATLVLLLFAYVVKDVCCRMFLNQRVAFVSLIVNFAIFCSVTLTLSMFSMKALELSAISVLLVFGSSTAVVCTLVLLFRNERGIYRVSGFSLRRINYLARFELVSSVALAVKAHFPVLIAPVFFQLHGVAAIAESRLLSSFPLLLLPVIGQLLLARFSAVSASEPGSVVLRTAVRSTTPALQLFCVVFLISALGAVYIVVRPGILSELGILDRAVMLPELLLWWHVYALVWLFRIATQTWLQAAGLSKPYLNLNVITSLPALVVSLMLCELGCTSGAIVGLIISELTLGIFGIRLMRSMIAK